MVLESNIKVVAHHGKFTLAELREFVVASDHLRSNAIVEVGLNESGHLEMWAKETVLKQF